MPSHPKRVMICDAQGLCQTHPEVDDPAPSAPHNCSSPSPSLDTRLSNSASCDLNCSTVKSKKLKMALSDHDTSNADAPYPPGTENTQPVAVLLRVTCLNGFWKGAVHYHHVLPPPDKVDERWFDKGFLDRRTQRGIVRVAKTPLLHHVDCMDENMDALFWAGMETLAGLYEESMVLTKEWVSLQSDFDGRVVRGDMTLRDLVASFLATKPKAGEPLILTPIMRRKEWHYVAYE